MSAALLRMKAKDNNEGGMEHGSQTVANSTSMTGGGDTSSAHVSSPVNDGELLELSAESTQHKPALRGKWSKIPVRLGNSNSNVGIEAGGSLYNISKNEPPSQTNGNAGEGTTPLTTIQPAGEGTAPLTTINPANEGTAPLTTIKPASSQTNPLDNDPNVNDAITQSTEQPTNATSEGVVATKESGDTEMVDASISNANTNSTLSGVASSGGDGKGVIGSGKSSRSRSTSITTTSTKPTNATGTINTLSTTNKATSHSVHHGPLSESTIANADALAYFSDDVIDINLMGVRHEQKVGYPLHICGKCDLPIAVYGRLVRLTIPIFPFSF